MLVDLNERISVVTGASGLIGRAIALRLAENGSIVAVCDIDAAKGAETVEMIRRSGGLAEYFTLDVSSKQAALQAAEEIFARFGRVDILINNAGLNTPPEKRAYIQNFHDDEWRKILEVDLDGLYYVSKAFLPHIIQTRGNVVNISSVVGVVPLRNQCAFAAAKAGVVNLTKAMAVELGESGVRVNVVAPGSVVPEGSKSTLFADPGREADMLSQVPLGRTGTADEIAKAVLFLASDDASYITGALLTVDGGWTCGFARRF